MTLTDEPKILDDKIKGNQVQYDLDREAPKISALSSKELDKYKYLTGEDLGYKPGVLEQAKFEYFPLGKVFNKGLEKVDKTDRLVKRLKNVKGKNKELLKAIKDQIRKQLDTIEKNNQLKVKKKDDKTKGILYLEEGVNKLVDLYSSSFNSRNIVFLKNMENYENKINYYDLSYKIFFTEKNVFRRVMSLIKMSLIKI